MCVQRKTTAVYGYQLLDVLLWAPTCVAKIIRDYLLLQLGDRLYTQDYEIRRSWDDRFYIITNAEYRTHRDKLVLKIDARLLKL